ncbi:hypothetical protein LJ737_26365 [Hymenobacter sp. 15J16-1T3B]|uniref:hypothetical protein n=1 Tax=Hymenobacter sp. 15J16-1T3B TaxID=2886941 RepID=UPI001D12C17D|nr:hypothetical protein [Hymenobacter sp. 15J16-1T3B]MCC3160789.1 hypothetical protein [Hymenobacter sp. 15J16-1T3B]
MKTDAYTKSVLTVIALCLVVLVLRGVDLVPRATAGAGTARQGIPTDRPIFVNNDGSINVRLQGIEGPLNVNVSAVGGNRVYGDKLPVQNK